MNDTIKAPEEIIELAESFYIPSIGSYYSFTNEDAHLYFLDPVLWAYVYLLNTGKIVVDRVTTFGIWYKRGNEYGKKRI